MDKLKNKILLMLLISIILCSVSAISVAEISDAGANDDVFDLSNDIENVEAESISNDVQAEPSSDVLGAVSEITDDEGVTVEVTPSGDITVGDTEHVDFNVSINGDLIPEGTVDATITGDNGYTDKMEGISFSAGVGSFDLSGLAPGKYTVEVAFSGDDHYGPASGTAEFNVLPLDTTTDAEDVSGNVGDKVDITADILDQNNDPVKNGTATLTVNGQDFTAEVENGKATFKGVELTENTTATIKYEGNDYYNPSETTIEITVNDENPDEEPSEEPDEEPDDEPTDDPVDDAVDDPVEEPASTVAKNVVAGNPIAMLLLVLMALVSTISIRRQK